MEQRNTNIQYANNKKFKKAKTKVVKNNTYLIKKLKSGKAYYLRVRVNGADDNWSKWSNVKRVFIRSSKNQGSPYTIPTYCASEAIL